MRTLAALTAPPKRTPSPPLPSISVLPATRMSCRAPLVSAAKLMPLAPPTICRLS
jgi:hypothetical protein